MLTVGSYTSVLTKLAHTAAEQASHACAVGRMADAWRPPPALNIQTASGAEQGLERLGPVEQVDERRRRGFVERRVRAVDADRFSSAYLLKAAEAAAQSREDAMTREHHHEVEIDATADQVWRSITDGDELTRWYADQAEVTPGEGGTVTVGWEGTQEGVSRIDRWEPGRRLRLVDQPSGDFPPLDEPTVQEWTIETRGGRTVLRLVHSGFPDTDDWGDINAAVPVAEQAKSPRKSSGYG